MMDVLWALRPSSCFWLRLLKGCKVGGLEVEDLENRGYVIVNVQVDDDLFTGDSSGRKQCSNSSLPKCNAKVSKLVLSHENISTIVQSWPSIRE